MRNLLIFITLFIVFTSCEEVIEVDINASSPRLVIEGILSDEHDSVVVKISRTTSYFSNETPPPVQGAELILLQADGQQYLLAETEAGIYRAHIAALTYNTQYTLQATIDGQKYTAASFLPAPVPIDSLYAEKSIFGPPDTVDNYLLTVFLTDPAQSKDFYRWKVYVNEVLRNDVFDLFYSNDLLFDGLESSVLLRTGALANDTVVIEQIACDEAYYDFLYTLNNTLTSSTSFTVPDNPISNWSDNKVLGYFTAYSVVRDTVILEP